MKWLKRLLLIVALMLLVAIGSGVVILQRVRSSPKFIHRYHWEGTQARGVVAQKATNNLVVIHNMAVNNSANESRLARTDGSHPPMLPADPLTVTFTEELLNASLIHYSDYYRDKYERFVTEPGIYLHEGNLVIAGYMTERGSYVSLHFKPAVGENGLRFDLVRCMAGNQTVPRFLLDGQFAKLQATLRKNIAYWQSRAKIDPNGSTNPNAVRVAMSELLVNSLDGKDSSPVLYAPGNDSEWMPVRLADMRIDGDQLIVTVAPIPRADREKLLEEIKRPFNADLPAPQP